MILHRHAKKSRELLADSKAGKNPFDGFTPSIPSGEVFTFGDNRFIQYEDAGVHEARKTAFVLVAGGLGERLGYNGIKVALPLESTTGTCFLQHYIESILALQETSCRLSKEVRTLELMTWVNWIKLFFCISITKNSMLKIKDKILGLGHTL